MIEKGGKRRDPGQYATFTVRMIQYGVKLSTFLEAAHVVLGTLDFVEKTVALRKVKLLVHGDLFIELWERYRPRFAAFYDNALDVTCHYCWKYFEPESFADVTPEQAERYGGAILGMYEATDRVMGKILSYAPEGLTVAVVSDHGQQATHTGEAGQVRLIRTENFLRILGLDESVDGINLASVVHLLPKRGGPLPEGLERFLEDVRNERTGEPVFDAYVDESGNFIVGPQPYVPIRGERVSVPGRGVFPADELVQETSATISGEHSLDAIFLLAGPNVRRGERGGEASLYDIAPTLLYAMGLPTGSSMVGRVLAPAFDPGRFATHPPALESYVLTAPIPEKGATPDDTMLKEQLRALGYLN
jgi:arylsulfatase A-like enzyme